MRLLAGVGFGLGLLLGLGFFYYANDDGQMADNGDVASVEMNTTFEPLVYTPSEWTAGKPLMSPFGDGQQLLTVLGDTATSEAGLDIDGKPATLYRYHNKNEPPLYVVDSDDFFEVNWYFASPKDTIGDKAASMAYAKKAYVLLGAILGEQAMALMSDMLEQKTANLPDGVVLGKCQAYQCQVVFKKHQN